MPSLPFLRPSKQALSSNSVGFVFGHRYYLLLLSQCSNSRAEYLASWHLLNEEKGLNGFILRRLTYFILGYLVPV